MKREAIDYQKETRAAAAARRFFLLAVFLSCGAAFGHFLLPAADAQDYSRFKHSNPTHNRLPCLVCHTRTDNSAAIRFPGHVPCASCHQAQFADNTNPMCTICHTTTGMKRFPGLKSFGARFDHAKHLRQTNCASCHKPTRSGVAFSIPAGAGAHNNCFTCHSSVSGNVMSSCGTCHQPGRLTRAPEWARAYNLSFAHSKHTPSMNCTTCHTVKAGAPRGRQVTSPVAAMHFAPRAALSCASCHNNKRAFGGEDFADCRRCHKGGSFSF
jgi:c(7)-type cytochrome triheme protein